MAFLSPGEAFKVKLSNGKTVNAVALNFRQERAISALEDTGRAFENATDVWDATERAVQAALPHMDEQQVGELLDGLNLPLAQELVKKVLQHQSLSEDDKKKPASPQ